MDKVYKGQNGNLILTDLGVQFKRSFKSFLLSGSVKGDKVIPYSSIIAVQFKKPGLTVGYLQLTLQGVETKQGITKAIKDENTITFQWNTKQFEEAKKIIETKILNSTHNTPQNNYSDLEKLSDLKEKGIISQEEFDKKKAQILGF